MKMSEEFIKIIYLNINSHRVADPDPGSGIQDPVLV
jgi:hypothetical protein